MASGEAAAAVKLRGCNNDQIYEVYYTMVINEGVIILTIIHILVNERLNLFWLYYTLLRFFPHFFWGIIRSMSKPLIDLRWNGPKIGAFFFAFWDQGKTRNTYSHRRGSRRRYHWVGLMHVEMRDDVGQVVQVFGWYMCVGSDLLYIFCTIYKYKIYVIYVYV